MKNKFYLILVTLIFLLSSCSEDNTSKQDSSLNNSETNKINTSKTSTEKVDNDSKKTIKKPTPIIYHYEFENLKKQANVLHIENDIYDFRNIKQPIVIMTIMSTWCPPCRGQIPHLSKLQKKFKDHLFVMGTLVHDDISTEKLKKFIIAQKMIFYISVKQEENLKFVNMLTPKLGLTKDFPMPLTIVFVKGKYFTHYEGMIPEEMIESDIKHLVEKIKK